MTDYDQFVARLNRRADGHFTLWERIFEGLPVSDEMSSTDKAYIERVERRLSGNRTSWDTIRDIMVEIANVPYEVSLPSLSRRFLERRANGLEFDTQDNIHVFLSKSLPDAIWYIPGAIINQINNTYDSFCETLYVRNLESHLAWIEENRSK